MIPDYMTCIHRTLGLCDLCQFEYDEDPDAWVEYGFHKAGIERWVTLQEEMNQASREAVGAADPDLPF